MSVAAFLEVVETEEGEFVLRRTDSSPGSSEPLVAIRFSSETRTMLADHLGEIARAMIAAGVQMTGQLHAGAGTISVEDDEPRLLH
ncbi:MAG: hypothetical protein REI12_13265 [Pedobacter sp.]|nr:hypothetical protein [Pedobacter sp.]